MKSDTHEAETNVRKKWRSDEDLTRLSWSTGRVRRSTGRNEDLKTIEAQVKSDARKGTPGAQKKGMSEEHLTSSSGWPKASSGRPIDRGKNSKILN